jgi:hypothetical protein
LLRNNEITSVSSLTGTDGAGEKNPPIPRQQTDIMRRFLTLIRAYVPWQT